MATAKYKRYAREKFKDWKERVAKHLPVLVTKFYASTGYIPYEKHVLLGTVIKEINNPYYTILRPNGEDVNELSVTGLEVVLELQVEELFAFIHKLP